MTLTDFLLQRIAEDEMLAKIAGQGDCNEWDYFPDGSDEPLRSSPEDRFAEGDVMTCAKFGTPPEYERRLSVTMRGSEGLDASVTADSGVHIARWDPARVLAECAAKRRVVDLYQTWEQETRHGDPLLKVQEITGATTLRALAAIYAAHPDYDESWTL